MEQKCNNHNNHNNHNTCDNCRIQQKKIELYENFFREMKILENEEKMIKNANNNMMENNIIIDKDENGNRITKLKSNLSESFIIVDHGKNITELDKKDQFVINEQKNLHDYAETKQYVEKANGIYSVVKYVINIGKWFVL